MHINDFNYHLPEELIAQYPSDQRDHSRLLVVDRKTGKTEHRHFYDILEYLHEGDCLVMNNSKVLPARLFGVKAMTGAKIEFLLIKRKDGDIWESMVKPGKKLKPGDRVVFSETPPLSAEILDFGEEGTRMVRFDYDKSNASFLELLDQLGTMPLPPYINRSSEEEDKKRYQTVYNDSAKEGSVAAPTAGLHFTEELLEQLVKKGVKLAQVTLHVGIGTFRPVKCEIVEEHVMHFEEFEIDEKNAAIINETKAAGGRVISVGTTSTRTVESAADENGRVCAGSGSTGIFIYPGYRFKVIDELITNFHLPKSTLLMLISALYDREKILAVYEQAVKEKYRFFSYGDAMYIK
ncbi:MAG: tRNA preQ1(34) S-adenosylmethionine ribosyltransferase-isomerase QueA [Eubacteriales bacterium]|nr:tRNA preQ1(34) S-adenosylmethionine ribosyltransferase-isomerase QueA [Eubacteriales bacterium]MDD3349313.1 tRNA preQ1(34) S-adenosylmethionine ribosyltransferase-isomerase QueA [Eubacteriales bacterium]